MTALELKNGYDSRLAQFKRVVDNLKQALEDFLSDHSILHLEVSGRIKSLESFIEKVNRKEYSQPFIDNEDFCGIRVIVYYAKDMDAVEEIIINEFDLQNSVNKADELEANEFGYRSKHYIVKIKSEWLVSPNYRGLDDIKIEIQVRTILMHAWAEIEHKLAYKSKAQIPESVTRNLALISAQLEAADKQVQALRDDIEGYKDEIKLQRQIKDRQPQETELNLDSLMAVMDHYLPDYPSNRSKTNSSLDRLVKRGKTFSDIESLLKQIRPHADSLNLHVFPKGKLRLTQATILEYAMDIFDSLNTDSIYSEKRKGTIEKFKKQILQ